VDNGGDLEPDTLATGNQWSDLNTGVMCSLRRVPVTSLAAAFCTDWRRWSWMSVMLYSRELQ